MGGKEGGREGGMADSGERGMADSGERDGGVVVMCSQYF